TTSRPPAARWSCWPRATARRRCARPARSTAASISPPSAARRRTSPSIASRRSRPWNIPSSAWRRSEDPGGKLPGLHRDRRQGQRFLQGIEFGLAVIPGRTDGASPQLNLRRACARVGGRRLNEVTRMACIKVADMAYGRLKAPDLDLMEEFL